MSTPVVRAVTDSDTRGAGVQLRWITEKVCSTASSVDDSGSVSLN